MCVSIRLTTRTTRASHCADPCPDHAVVSVKFARECIVHMIELVEQLAFTLGPETEDLAVRFGVRRTIAHTLSIFKHSFSFNLSCPLMYVNPLLY